MSIQAKGANEFHKRILPAIEYKKYLFVIRVASIGLPHFQSLTCKRTAL